MERTSSQPKSSEQLQELLRSIKVPDDRRFANLAKLQQERARKEDLRRAARLDGLGVADDLRTSAGHPSGRPSSAEQERQRLYQLHQERRRREAALEAGSADFRGDSDAINQALAQSKEQREREYAAMNLLRQKQQLEMPDLRRSATAPAESRKPNKIVQAIGGLLSGLDVRSRPWQAPSDDLIEYHRTREAMLLKQKKDAEDVKALDRLVADIQAKGAKNSDVSAILKAVVDRKTSAEEARKRLAALKAGKAYEDMKPSLAEQEKIALMQHEAARLTILKLQFEQREEARKEVAAMEEKLKKLGLAARIVTEEDELLKLQQAAQEEQSYLHEDDAMFGGGLSDSPLGIGRLPGLQRSQTLDGRSRALDPMMFDNGPGTLEGLFEPTQSRTTGLPGPSAYGGRYHVDEYGRPLVRKPMKIDPWITSMLDEKAKLYQRSAPAAAEGEHQHDYIDPRLDPHDPYFDPRFARLHEKQRLEAERKEQLEHAKLLENEREKEEIRQQELRVKQLEEEERKERERDAAKAQQQRASAHAAAVTSQARMQASSLDKEAAIQQAMRREAAAKQQMKQAAGQEHIRRQAAGNELAAHQQNAIAKEQILRHEHDLRTREGIEARKSELQKMEQQMMALHRAEGDEKRRAARSRELERLQNQLIHVENLEKLMDEEEQRDRLLALMQDNPQALTKAFDLQDFARDPSLLHDPALLDKALRLVATASRKPGHSRTPSPKPPPVQAGFLGREMQPTTPKAHPSVSDFPPHLLGDFITAGHAAQDLFLRQMKDEVLRKQFLQHAVAAASEEEAHELYERFHHLGYDLDLYMPGASETSLGGRTPVALGSRTPVPDIIIDRVRSPPTDQDRGPHITERYIDDIPLHTEDFALPDLPKVPDVGGQDNPTADPTSMPDSDSPSDGASTPRQGALVDLPRTAAAHPAGQQVAEGDTMSESAEEAEAIKRELQEIAEAEGRLAALEGQASPLALEADALAPVLPDSQMVPDTAFPAIVSNVDKIQTPKAISPKTASLRAASARAASEKAASMRTTSSRAASQKAAPPPGSVLPTPPPPFIASSPPIDRLASPKGSLILSPRSPVPMPDLGGIEDKLAALPDEPASIAAWASATAAASPGSTKSGGKLRSPKAVPVEADELANMTPRMPAQNTPRASRASSPAARSVKSNRSARPSSPNTQSAVAAASPVISHRSAARVASPPLVRAAVDSTPKIASTGSEAGDHNDPARSPSNRSARVPVASPVKSRVVSPVPSASSPLPAMIADLSRAAGLASPQALQNQANPEAVSPKEDVSGHITPQSPPKAKAMSVAPSPLQPAIDRQSSPSPSRTIQEPAPQDAGSIIKASKGATPIVEILTSPGRQASSPLQEGWASPPKDAASTEHPVTAAQSPSMAKGPSAKATSPPAALQCAPVSSPGPIADAAGDPVSVLASPAPSRARSQITARSTASPAFGLAVSPKQDTWAAEADDHQKTATKGSDPVVVSMAQQAAPQPVPSTDGQPGYDDEVFEDEPHEFVFEDFMILHGDEPLDPGMHIDMAENMPQGFEQVYPKKDGATPEAIEHHLARTAFEHGFDALYQFAIFDEGDHFKARGYMVCLIDEYDDPHAPTGADYAITTPQQAAMRSPSKQAKVTDGSEAG